MRKDHEQALQLRLSGKSYNEITKILGVPRGTLSGWFAGLLLSPSAQRRIQKRVHDSSLHGLIRRNRNQTHLARQRMLGTRKQARKTINKLYEKDLKLIGVALYWAEGYKRAVRRNGRDVTQHPVALTNSDPKLVCIFLRFLREVCKVESKDIHADIRIYQHMNTKHVAEFWQKITKIPSYNFGKVYYGISKSSLGKRPFTRLQYGTILIRVNRTALFHQIMGWIEGVADQAAMV